MRTLKLLTAALVGLTMIGCASTPPAAPSAPPSHDPLNEGEMTEAIADPTAACQALLTADELSSLTGIAGFTFEPDKSDVDRAGIRLCAFDTPDPGAGVDSYVATYDGTAYAGEFILGLRTFVDLPDVVPVPGLDGPAYWQPSTSRLFVDLADRGLQVYFATETQAPDRNLSAAVAIAKLLATR